MPKPSDLLQGTLDLLILKTIAREPLHGWAIAKRIQALSGDVLAVGQGSLYPALHRLEQQGWIDAKWKDSDLGRPAKVYSLTREGRKFITPVFARHEKDMEHVVSALTGAERTTLVNLLRKLGKSAAREE